MFMVRPNTRRWLESDQLFVYLPCISGWNKIETITGMYDTVNDYQNMTRSTNGIKEIGVSISWLSGV